MGKQVEAGQEWKSNDGGSRFVVEEVDATGTVATGCSPDGSRRRAIAVARLMKGGRSGYTLVPKQDAGPLFREETRAEQTSVAVDAANGPRLEWRGEGLYLGVLEIAQVRDSGMMTGNVARWTFHGVNGSWTPVSTDGTWADRNARARAECHAAAVAALRAAGVVVDGK